MFNNFFRKGKQITELSIWLNIAEDELKLWLNGLPDTYGYTTFKIPKKKKGEFRTIDAPNKKLRNLQTLIYRKLLRKLHVHECAKGFVPKISIVGNALVHQQQEVVINIDLKDFFHTISEKQVITFWQNLGWGKQTAQILTNICCYKERLPQGSPTSPALSNLVNLKLDSSILGLIRKYGGSYTRYADDITLSFADFGTIQKGLLATVTKIIHDNGYLVNKKKKIRIQRPHQRQTVTGLVVNQKVNLPRSVRRRMRAMRYHQQMGTLSAVDIKKLAGLESLKKMIEDQSKGYKIADKKIINQYLLAKSDQIPSQGNKFNIKLETIITIIIFAVLLINKIYSYSKPPNLKSETEPSSLIGDQCPTKFQCSKMKIDINEILAKADNKKIEPELTQYQRWAIALGAVLTEQAKLPQDQLDFSNNYYHPTQLKNGLQLMLVDSWGITDRKTMIETFDWLVNKGHSRDDYLPIYLYIKNSPDKSVSELSENLQSQITLSEDDKARRLRNILYIKESQLKNNNLVYAWDYGRFIFLVRAANHVDYLTDSEALSLIEETGKLIRERFHSWQEFGDNYVLGRILWGMDKSNIYSETQEIYQDLLEPDGQWTKIPWDWSEDAL